MKQLLFFRRVGRLTHARAKPLVMTMVAVLLAFPLCSTMSASALAQTTFDATSGQVRPSSKKAVARPSWKELSIEQQQALQPLSANWDALSAERKKKWLAMSNNFHSMSGAEQQLLHSRMRGWAQLSQQQRAQARLNYSEAKSLSAEEKSAQWQSYQKLNAEERRRLAAKAPGPAGVAVVRPVTAEKQPSLTRGKPEALSHQAKTTSASIQANTLLPRRAAEERASNQPPGSPPQTGFTPPAGNLPANTN